MSKGGNGNKQFLEKMYSNAHWIALGLIAISWLLFLFGHKLALSSVRAEKAAELLLLTAGLASLLLLAYQVKWQRHQQRNEFHFNRIDAFYNHFIPRKELIDNVEKLCSDAEINQNYEDGGHPLTKEQVARLMKDHKSGVLDLLDSLESLCAAVISGYVDGDFAYCLTGGRVVKSLTIYGPFIAEIQKGNPKAYVELAKVGKQWRDRREKELEKQGAVTDNIISATRHD